MTVGMRQGYRFPLLFWLLLGIGSLLLGAPGAQPLPTPVYGLDQGQARQVLQQLQLFRDVSAQLTIDHVRSPQYSPAWRTVTGGLNWQFSPDAFWLHWQLQGSSASEPLLLEVDGPLLDEVDVWLYPEGSSVATAQMHDGDLKPISQRLLQHRQPLLAIPALPTGQRYDVYVRLHSSSWLAPQFTLWQPEAFLRHERYTQLIFGCFFGVLAVMALYNLFLGLGTRLAEYRRYFFYTASIALFVAATNGFAHQYLWPDWVWAKQHGISLSICLSFGTALLFGSRYLELSKNSLFLLRLLNFFTACYAVLAVFAALLPESTMLPILQPLGNVVAAVAMIGSLQLCLRRVRQAYIFLAGWSVLIIGTLIYTLMQQGVLQRTPLTEYMQTVGFLLETLILSFGLADRINQERKSRHQAMQQSLDLTRELQQKTEALLSHQQQANETLERRVAQRTAELQTAMQHLADANRQLEALSMTDQLTGLYNRRHLAQQLPLSMSLAQRGDFSIALFALDIDFFKKINDLYGHGSGDLCLQSVAKTLRNVCRRISDSAIRLGGEEFLLIFSHTDRAGAVQLAEEILVAVRGITVNGPAGELIRMTISIGIVLYPPYQATTPERLILQADEALYQAKHNGRNTYVLATP